MMDAQELAAARDCAVDVAREAGTVVLRGYRSGAEVRKKGAIDLVTDYDLRSEALIRERLNRAFPGHGLVAEEAAVRDYREQTWFVDPIDGTTNFAHGHPFFAVSIALYEGDTPAVGVVYAPALQVLWSCARGLGTRRNDVPCTVSRTARLEDALCATGFPYDRATSDENNFREFVTFKRRARGVRRCGSAAIDLALVGDGTYDAYWEQKLQAWDMTAGAALVLEAGGRLSDYDGHDADPRTGRLVATNAWLHAQVLETLRLARSLPPI